jgi:ABC-type glycerol-3-phosphate transport system substrate-binding protein
VLPFPRDAQAATYAEVEVFAISPRTKHPQACWSWIVFLSRQISSNARLAPARRSLVESAEYKRLVGEELASVVQAALENAIIPPSSEQFTQFQGELEAFGRAMEMITAGQLTPQEALEWVQTQGK